MQTLNNVNIKGTLTIGNLTNADLIALGTPEYGVSSYIYNIDNQRLEQWDGSAWVAVVHPEATRDPLASPWLTVDATTQVIGLNIPESAFYSRADVDQLFTDLKGGVGGALDTLVEIETKFGSLDTDLATILTDIGNNDAEITAIQSDIANNATDIADNATDIATNVSEIASNDADIATNASGISTNAAGVAANLAAITSNDTDIADNASDISTLQAASHPAISLGASNNVALTLDAATQELTLDLTGIGGTATTNAAGVAANLASINANDADISALQNDVAANDTDIAALQADTHVAATVAVASNSALTVDVATQEFALDLSTVNTLSYDNTSDTLSDALGGSVALDTATATTNGLMGAADKVKVDFVDKFSNSFDIVDFVVDPINSTKYVYTVTDARLTVATTMSMQVIDAAGKVVLVDMTSLDGSVELRVNRYPDARFAGTVNFVVSQ